MSDLSTARALAYDMVYNGVEVLFPVPLSMLSSSPHLFHIFIES